MSSSLLHIVNRPEFRFTTEMLRVVLQRVNCYIGYLAAAKHLWETQSSSYWFEPTITRRTRLYIERTNSWRGKNYCSELPWFLYHISAHCFPLAKHPRQLAYLQSRSGRTLGLFRNHTDLSFNMCYLQFSYGIFTITVNMHKTLWVGLANLTNCTRETVYAVDIAVKTELEAYFIHLHFVQ